jgi:ketosteroid isomerase-like protein
MSQENVEVVRRIYEAVASRDTATVLSLYDPDVEWDFSRGPGIVAAGIYRGHEGLRRWFREWYAAWETLDDTNERLIDVGHHVISVSNIRGRGRTSGLEATLSDAVGVWTVREGKVVRVVWFGPPALEAVGLSE